MSEEVQMIDLPAKFTASEAVNIKKFLGKALTRYKAIKLNGDKVIQMDISGVQLLVAFTIAMDASNISWTWHEPSEPLLSTVIDAGMVDVLKILENAA